MNQFRQFETSSPQATTEDQTPLDFTIRRALKDKILGGFRKFVYPLKNAAERRWLMDRLVTLDPSCGEERSPDALYWGPRGFGLEPLVRRIRSLGYKPNTVTCLGCGAGTELLLIAKHLRPKQIIGYEFFNYARAWSKVSDRLQSEGISVHFSQVDLRKDALSHGEEKSDLVVSCAVLEHLSEMNVVFRRLAATLNPSGIFAAAWGPMWSSYSGDHIAGELGLACGYEHLRLPAHDYFQWYCRHPRNREDVALGKPTWIQLGLHNYSLYREYLSSINQAFGPTRFIGWQISKEAFKYKSRFPGRWNEMLSSRPQLRPLDLVLSCAEIIAGHQ